MHLPRTLVPLAAAAVLLTACGSSDGGGDAAPAAPSPSSTRPGTAAAEPVIDQDFPDPDALVVDGTTYLYATQPAGQGTNVQVARSQDLTTWEVLDEDPLPDLPAWATTGRTWAPEVAAVDDGYVMYSTMRSIDPDLQCIGVAAAQAPEGPFTPVGEEPLLCPEDLGGAIDAASFVDEDGSRYLLWKNDGNCCGLPTWIHLQRLTPDGLALDGDPVQLITQDLPWEGELVEAPTLVRRDGRYVLLYSANGYGGGDYALGYATAPSLEGPWTKSPEPLLSTEGTGGRYTGPGGQDVVTDAEGRDHLLFHDWDDAVVYRGVHVADLAWEDGQPRVTLPAS